MVVEYFLARRRNRNNESGDTPKHAGPKHTVTND
jgi:hypothetical protein